MLTTKRNKETGEYHLNFDGKEYVIYRQIDAWVVEHNDMLVCESETKIDLLDKLEDILVFGW